MEPSASRRELGHRVGYSVPAILEHLMKLVFLDHSRDWDRWVTTIVRAPMMYLGMSVARSRDLPPTAFYMEQLYYGPLCDNDNQPNRRTIKIRIKHFLEDDQWRRIKRLDKSEVAQDLFVDRLEAFMLGLSKIIADQSLSKQAVEQLLRENYGLSR